MRKKLWLYVGSFSPMHTGHLNIKDKIKRVAGDDEMLIGIGSNPAKPASDIDERAKKLSEKLNCQVIAYTCFLHELILQKEAEGYDVVLARGLRNGDDLAYEENQIKFILEFLPKDYHLNVVFFMSDEPYKHVSSSAVRQLESFRPGSAEHYII